MTQVHSRNDLEVGSLVLEVQEPKNAGILCQLVDITPQQLSFQRLWAIFPRVSEEEEQEKFNIGKPLIVDVFDEQASFETLYLVEESEGKHSNSNNQNNRNSSE